VVTDLLFWGFIGEHHHGVIDRACSTMELGWNPTSTSEGGGRSLMDGIRDAFVEVWIMSAKVVPFLVTNFAYLIP
jgi:hypothetical protein